MKSAKNEELYPDLPKQVTAIPDEAEQQAKIEAAEPVKGVDATKEETPQDEVKLSKSIEVNGVKTGSLKISIGLLTTAAATKAERLFYLKVPDFPEDKNIFASMTYWTILGSLAADIPYSVVEQMSMKDSLELAGATKIAFFGR